MLNAKNLSSRFAKPLFPNQLPTRSTSAIAHPSHYHNMQAAVLNTQTLSVRFAKPLSFPTKTRPPQHICKRAPFAPAHKGCEPHPQPRPRVLFCLTRAAHESRHGSQSAQRSAQLFFTEGIKKKRTSSSPSPSRSSRTLHSLGRTSCSSR